MTLLQLLLWHLCINVHRLEVVQEKEQSLAKCSLDILDAMLRKHLAVMSSACLVTECQVL